MYVYIVAFHISSEFNLKEVRLSILSKPSPWSHWSWPSF